MKIDARISILTHDSDDGREEVVEISIVDYASHTEFLSITMTTDQFVKAALGRLAHSEVKECEVRGLERVGKNMEMDTLEFVMPKCEWKDRDKIAKELAAKECPAGWTPDLSFGSKNSFFNPGPGMADMARTTIRRWVETQ